MRIRLRAATAAILGIAAVVTVGAVSGRAGAPLTVAVTPHVAIAPATLRIRATVDQHADNRGLQVQVLSNGYCRSSFIQLDGADAPRTTTMTYPEVPGGLYEIRTTVIGPGGEIRATTSDEIKILSRFDD